MFVRLILSNPRIKSRQRLTFNTWFVDKMSEYACFTTVCSCSLTISNDEWWESVWDGRALTGGDWYQVGSERRWCRQELVGRVFAWLVVCSVGWRRSGPAAVLVGCWWWECSMYTWRCVCITIYSTRRNNNCWTRLCSSVVDLQIENKYVRSVCHYNQKRFRKLCNRLYCRDK